MKKLLLITIVLAVVECSFAQNKSFVYDNQTLNYQRVDGVLLEKLKKKEPSLYRTLFYINNSLDGCQRSIRENKNPDLHGRYNVTEQVKYLGEILKTDYRKYSEDINYDSYIKELDFYEVCSKSIVAKDKAIKARQKLIEDSTKSAVLEEKQRVSKKENESKLSELKKQDSIRMIRKRFPHDYGTIFGDVPLFDAGSLDIFMQSNEYMELALVDGGTIELKDGYRNTYETKSGQRYLLYVDYKLEKSGGQTVIKELKIHGYFDLVVKFYVDYWPFDLTFADFKKPGEIKRYFITDEILFTADLPKDTATITIKKATL